MVRLFFLCRALQLLMRDFYYKRYFCYSVLGLSIQLIFSINERRIYQFFSPFSFVIWYQSFLPLPLTEMARGGQHNNDNIFQLLTSPTSGSTTTQSNQSLMENTNNPFFLHSGDHPGLVLVSHLLTGSSYNTWSWAMLMALNVKNKLGFMDGTLSQPMTDYPTARIWPRCNNMVTSWLLNAVSKKIVNSSHLPLWRYERFDGLSTIGLCDAIFNRFERILC